MSPAVVRSRKRLVDPGSSPSTPTPSRTGAPKPDCIAFQVADDLVTRHEALGILACVAGSRQAHRPVRRHKAEAVPAIAPGLTNLARAPGRRDRRRARTAHGSPRGRPGRHRSPRPRSIPDPSASGRLVSSMRLMASPPRRSLPGSPPMSRIPNGDKCQSEPCRADDRKSGRTGVPPGSGICTSPGRRRVTGCGYAQLRAVLPDRSGVGAPRRALVDHHPAQHPHRLPDLQRDRRRRPRPVSRAAVETPARVGARRGDRDPSQARRPGVDLRAHPGRSRAVRTSWWQFRTGDRNGRS